MAERWDSLDILVNNAGANWGVPLAEQDSKSWHRVLDVNVEGVFHITKFLLPLLQKAGTAEEPARVINIGSVDGIQVPGFETYAYSASKAAVHQLTRHLAKHLAPTITVNAIAPGPFQSRMMRATLEAAGDGMAKMMPLQADRPARGHGRSGHLPVVEGRCLHDRHDRPGRRRHRHDEVARRIVPVEPPPTRWRFPPVDVADEHGVVARRRRPRARHAPRRLPPGPLPDAASARDGPMAWWSPDPRGVLPLDGRAPQPFAAAVDRAATRCGSTPRSPRWSTACADPRRPGGWITDDIRAAYVRLHELGWAHSVEAWDDDGLAGGLYGVAIGGLFAGESMFHRRTDASKVALVGAGRPARGRRRRPPAARRAVGDRAPRVARGRWRVPRRRYLALPRRDARSRLPAAGAAGA